VSLGYGRLRHDFFAPGFVGTWIFFILRRTKTTFRDPIEWEDTVLAPLGFRASTRPWRAIVKAIWGSPLTPEEREIYLTLSDGIEPSPDGAALVFVCAGRRSGKSEACARILFYVCAVEGNAHSRFLAPGQIGMAAVIAQDLAGAQHVIDYAKGLAEHAHFAPLIEDVKVESVTFKNGLRIGKLPSTETAVRGPTIVCGVLDEVAAWDTTGPDEDRRVVRALTPGLLVSGDAPTRRLIAISSAGYRQGWAYDLVSESFGKPGQQYTVLSGPTLLFRPDLTEKDIDKLASSDRLARSREFESIWSDTHEASYFETSVIDACTTPEGTVYPRPYEEGARYVIAIDAAYQVDAFAYCVVSSTMDLTPDRQNRVRKTRVVEIGSWRPGPNEPLSMVRQAERIAMVCARYGVRTVVGDQHAHRPLADALRNPLRADLPRVKLVQKAWHQGASEESKTSRYGSVRDSMAMGSVEIPHHPELREQLLSMAAKPLASGGLKIEGRGKHDDLVSALVLACSEAMLGRAGWVESSLTRWERNERAVAQRRLDILKAGGY